MERLPRKAYTYEFKMEAVRLVESGQSVAQAARTLGVVEQTLSNWIHAHKAGKLTAHGRGLKLTAEQIESIHPSKYMVDVGGTGMRDYLACLAA